VKDVIYLFNLFVNLASETDFNERAQAFEKIVGMEIDRLNDNISDLEKERENQKKDIELYDIQLRIKLEELRETNATVEEQEKKIKELETNPEICELDDKLLKMEKEKDSLKFDINLYDAQLRIEIEKRRDIQLAINMLQKEKTDLVCTVEAKEESIKELTHEKETIKDALTFLKEQKPFSNVEVIKRTRMIQSKLLIESEKNKELEENILALNEEIKCLKKTNEECSNEAKQQLEIQKNKMIATLQTHKEDIGCQWKREIDKAIKLEEDKRKSVSQDRDKIIQMVQELNSALKKKENECNQLKVKVESLEEKLLEKTQEVQSHSDANVELAEKIRILEGNISALTEEIKCLEKKNQIILNEAKQQIECQNINVNAALQKQKEDIDNQWKIEIDKVIKHEKKKRIIVSQQRDEMMQTFQELKSTLEETKKEAAFYANVCNQQEVKVESLEQKIGILETGIQQKRQVIPSEKLKLVETVRMLKDRGSTTEIGVQTEVRNTKQKVL